MPTVCKITLDASEYSKALETIVAESRAASAQMAGAFDASSSAAKKLASDAGGIPSPHIEITSNAEEAAAEAKAAIESVKGGDVSIDVTGGSPTMTAVEPGAMPEIAPISIPCTIEPPQPPIVAEVAPLKVDCEIATPPPPVLPDPAPIVIDAEIDADGAVSRAAAPLRAVPGVDIPLTVTSNAEEALERAKGVVESIPTEKDINITVPEVPPVDIKVVADTVALSRLKAEIAELEAQEITLQTQVIDDDIARLSGELAALQNKDVTVTSSADLAEIQKLRAVIASLENKKIVLKTEVHSEKLDALRGKMDAATAGTSKMSFGLKNLMSGNIGEQIGKGATAIGAVGSVAGASVPAVGALGAVVNALTAPLALITAVLSALVAIGMAVWDKLTVSAEEYASKMADVAAASTKAREEEEASQKVANQYLERLNEMRSSEAASNTGKAETAALLDALTGKYGDLGAVIDETTGRITNLADVQAKINAQNKTNMLGKLQQEITDIEASRKASYVVKQKGFTGLAGSARNEFDAMNKMSTKDQLAFAKKKQADATDQNDLDTYKEQIEMLEKILKLKTQAQSIRNTGYNSEEEAAAARQRKGSAIDSGKNAVTENNKRFAQRKADDEFANAKTPEEKTANRQKLIESEKANQSSLRTKIAAASDKAKNGKTESERQDAEIEKLKLAKELQASEEKIYGWQQQIKGVQQSLAESKKKMTESSSFELEYQKLISAGKFKEAEALKLNYNLAQQKLNLTEAEKKAELEKQAALKNLKVDNMVDKGAQEVRYQELITAGKFKEAEALKLNNSLKEQGLEATDEQKKKILEQQEAQKKLDTKKQIQEAQEEVKLQELLVAGNFAAYEAEKLRLEAKRQGKVLTEKETEDLLKQREAKKKLDTKKQIVEGQEELNLQKLLAQGNYEAYEAEKLRLEAKRQGKVLTEKETEELLKQRKAMGALNLQKSLKEQGLSLKDQAMKNAGFEKQADEEKALRDAEKQKGAKLTPEEEANVKRISELNYQMKSDPGVNNANMDIKTNALTSRGGFAGGAVVPDKDRINNEIKNYSKRQLDTLNEIKQICDNLGKF